MNPVKQVPILLVGLASVAAAQQGASISNTKHNLSVTGPGPYRAEGETRICFFCHAPHRARPTAPLWNREDSATSYLTYESSTFEGNISQPNGSTKLCMSCHDGTIALGKIVSANREISMNVGRQRLLEGSGFLGASLRDDHPVSFRYTSSKAAGGLEYKPSGMIPKPVRLDHDGQVQCTTCHDPHNNSKGSFLHQSDRNSELCMACHTPNNWAGSAHATSHATWNKRGENPWPDARYETVRENGCASCHKTHGAGHPERLLKHAAEEENCLRCHNGNVARTDIRSEISKASAHNPMRTIGVHDPTEDPRTMTPHAECVDCHNPHEVRATTESTTGVPGPLIGVEGVSSSGTRVKRINHDYELCYKCHSDYQGGNVEVARVLQPANTRMEFAQGNPSFHPVEAAGRNSDVPSLLPPWNTASRMTCTDCHTSDNSPKFGGTGPRGPHGSVHRPLLGARYTTKDGTRESATEYALCYKCHSRGSILSDITFKSHRLHIVNERTPCSVCHDAHGVSSSQGTEINNSNLINFDRAVVTPSILSPGPPKFVDLGSRKGTCTLMCHGKDHDNLGY